MFSIHPLAEANRGRSPAPCPVEIGLAPVRVSGRINTTDRPTASQPTPKKHPVFISYAPRFTFSKHMTMNLVFNPMDPFSL